MATMAQQKKSEIDNNMLTEGVFKKQELSQTCKNGQHFFSYAPCP